MKPLRRILLYFLIFSLAFPPALFGAGVTPDPAARPGTRPSIDSAANGVPLVNIAAPNHSGLSHNQYTDFNVGREGLILNNSVGAGVSQLGGAVAGNPHLQGGLGAALILNEVTSANRSHIEGYTEVHGRRADVVLANPNGITVNGGGFINVPRAVLTTGDPRVEGGLLQGYDVRQGDIRIEGDGLNADNMDAFAIYSRTAQITGELHAKDLRVVAGRNTVDADTGRAAPLPPSPEDGPAPAVAIDTSLLGGMYAGRISLVSTEKGVGVNLQGSLQSASDMTLTADGRLVLREATAERDMRAAATSLESGEYLAAGRDLVVNAEGGVALSGSVLARGNLNVKGVSVSLDNAGLAAEKSVSLDAANVGMKASSLYSGGDSTLAATETFTLTEGSTIHAKGDLSLTGSSLALTGESALSSGGDMAFHAPAISFAGESNAYAQGSMNISGNELNVREALLFAEKALIVSAERLINTGGALYANSDASYFVTDKLWNEGGEFYAGDNMLIAGADAGSRARLVLNQSGSIFTDRGDLSVKAAQMTNEKKLFETVSEYLGQRYEVVYCYVNPRYNNYHNYIRTYQDKIVADSAAATVSAGRHLSLEAVRLDNGHSFITAAGNAVINAGVLHNKGTDLLLREDYSVYSDWHEHGDDRRDFWTSYSEYTPQGFAAAAITAGGTLQVNTTENLNNHSVNVAPARPIHADPDNGSLIRPGTGSGGTEGGETPAASLLLLPASVLFKSGTNQNHPYKRETNPALTSMSAFYGSEYFLSRAGLDLADLQHRLLGDAYYETRLVQNQIMEATGRRYLDGYCAETDQMQALLSNAAEIGTDLKLSVGVALTADQIAALTKDIVWLVEQEVDGETVLVPKLYLAGVTSDDLLEKGATLQGREVYLAAGKDVLNSGGIRGERVRAAAANIVNNGGSVYGASLDLVTGNDLINEGGLISGVGIRLVAGNDILSRATTHTTSSSVGWNTQIYSRSGITASGDLNIHSNRDILLQGNDLSAGGDAVLVAGRDLALNTTVTGMSTNAHYGRTNLSLAETSHVLSEIGVTGELSIQSGRDITLSGARITAGGDASVTADGNVSVEAVKDSRYTYIQSTSGGGLGGSGSSLDVIRDERVSGSDILAGGGLTVVAGLSPARRDTALSSFGNIVITGSSAGAEGGTTLEATGDIVLNSAVENSYQKSEYSSGNVLSSRSSLSEQSSTRNTGSVVYGERVNLRAGDNVLIAGGRVEADQDLLAYADKGDVAVSAVRDASSSRQERSRGGFGLSFGGGGVSVWEKSMDLSAAQRLDSVGSVLSAGNDMKLEAGRDVSAIGSSLTAGKDLGLYAGRDVNLIPGQEASASSQVSKRESVGLSFSQSGFGASLFAGYAATETGTDVRGDYNAASLIRAGNDVIVEAGRDVNQLGSHVEAGRDIALDTGRDWNMSASYDRESLDQYVKNVRLGITASASVNALDQLQKLGETPRNAMAGKGGLGYSAATAAGSLLKAVDAIRSGVSQYASASVTAGVSGSHMDYHAASTTPHPSTVTAGRDLIAGASRDVSMEAGAIVSDRDILLDAGRDVAIASARHSSSSSLSYNSAGAGIGLAADVSGSGIASGLTVTAQAAAGKDSGSSLVHDNALIVAGDTLSVLSGRDTGVRGANLEGERVWMDVGGDLTVASLQDYARRNSSSWSAAMEGTMGLGAGSSGLGGSLNASKAGSSSLWTGEQSSIVGRREADIYVRDNTRLVGGLIKADNGNLLLNTGTLSYEAILDRKTSGQLGFGMGGSMAWPGEKREFGSEERAILDEEKDPYEKPRIDAILDKSVGQLISPAASDSPFAAIPGSMAIQYGSAEREGLLRPTIGEGIIVVRDEPNRDLSGLNRDVNDAREIGGESGEHMDLYVSPGAIREMARYREMAEFHNGYVGNFLPGLGINEALTGRNSRETDGRLNQEYKEGIPQITDMQDLFTSDRSPFLKFLYHTVPGFKSYSEIHDVQMKHLSIYYLGEANVPDLTPVTSIPPSFLNSMIYALGTTLDIRNLYSNWATYIKPSFRSRTDPSQNEIERFKQYTSGD